MNTVTQHFWPDFYDQRCIGSPKVSLSKFQCLWDVKFLNGNGCKNVTAEKKGHVLFEVIFTHHVSSSFWIFGWLAWDKAQCQLTRTGKRIWGNKNYCFSTNVFNTSAIVSWVSFGEPSHRDLSSNNQPTFLKSLIFQAKFIQLHKVHVKYKFNYPGQFLHMF